MTYEFKTDPWEHQREAMRRAWRQPGFAWFMEMGTGKTKVDVDETSLYFEELMLDAWVVLAPKGVYLNWVREIDTHMPERVREQARIAIWRPGGGNKTQQRELATLLEKSPRLSILLMNVEAVSTVGPARTYLERFLRSHTTKMSLDESTVAKNPDAARSKYLHKMSRLARWRRIMTGSPVTRSPLDLYSQFEIVEPGYLGRSYYAFRARYAVLRDMHMGSRRVTVVDGYRNTEELAERIKPLSFRVTKDECLDLPPKVYTRRDVELTPEQQRMYVQLRDEAITEVSEAGATMSAQLVITQLVRLHQLICGHVTSDDGDVTDVPSNRLSVMMEVCAEISGKAIIWSRYRRDIEQISAALAEEYGPASVAQYHGGNVDTRQADAQRFITDPECRWMVSNQQSGGYGNTWIVANTVIYFSNDFSLERRMQSEDRAHRGGQTSRVTYVDLMARGTVDEKFVETLRRGIDIASTITGDGYRQWLI